ncbi:MAG: phage virion morphogenesis protein [Deltaproteobacteria bacterium]|nr:MAG: phage virion morphogenesis protein [Deltaproteobacteria bacterium]
MTGTMMDIQIEDHGIQSLLRRIQRQTQNLTPAMNIIGQIVRTSIVRNFEKEGRPQKWKAHSETTEKRRGKGASILREESHLMNSIHPKAYFDRAEIGTNRVYAAVHQFGAKKGAFGTFSVMQQVKEHIRKIKGKSQKVRAHKRTRRMSVPWGDIPARPFMLVQTEDWDKIRESLSDYILGGKR